MNNSKRYKVYVAMPIHFTEQNHVDLFTRAAEILREYHLDPVLPVDGMDTEEWVKGLRNKFFYSACLDLVESDLKLLQSCDAVLAVLPRPSIGVAMEICYASRWGLRVVTVCTLQTLYHPWVHYHSDYIVWSEDPFGAGLHEAAQHLFSVFEVS